MKQRQVSVIADEIQTSRSKIRETGQRRRATWPSLALRRKPLGKANSGLLSGLRRIADGFPFPPATETSGQAKRLYEDLLNSIAAVKNLNIMLGTWSMPGG